jgi:hypothetical protein
VRKIQADSDIPHLTWDSPFALPLMMMPPTKATIKRKFAHAACRMVRTWDGFRANGLEQPLGSGPT